MSDAAGRDVGMRENDERDYRKALQRFRRGFIRSALLRHGGNQVRAAAEMGVHRNSLARTMQELGMPRWRELEAAGLRRTGMRGAGHAQSPQALDVLAGSRREG